MWCQFGPERRFPLALGVGCCSRMGSIEPVVIFLLMRDRIGSRLLSVLTNMKNGAGRSSSASRAMCSPQRSPDVEALGIDDATVGRPCFFSSSCSSRPLAVCSRLSVRSFGTRSVPRCQTAVARSVEHGIQMPAWWVGRVCRVAQGLLSTTQGPRRRCGKLARSGDARPRARWLAFDSIVEERLSRSSPRSA